MPPTVFGVLTTRAGGTSSTWLLAMAATLSQMGKKVACLDLDMEGGTLLSSLRIDSGHEGKSLNNLLGAVEVDTSSLMQQMLTVPGYPNLRLLPGLKNARFGPELRRPLLNLEQAIKGLADDYVFLDLGHPISHANLGSPQTTLDAISVVCDQVYIVVKDDPSFMVQAIDVLKNVHFQSAHVVICEYRKGRVGAELRQAFTKHTRLKPIAGWSWDDKKAHQVQDQGKPWQLKEGPKVAGLID